MLLRRVINANTRFKSRRRRHRIRPTTPRPSLAHSRRHSPTTRPREQGTRRRRVRRTPPLPQTTLRRHTTRRPMRTPARPLPSGIPPFLGTPTTATATTTRPPPLTSPRPTSRRRRQPTAGRNRLRRQHLRLRNDMSLHCTARNMRHPRRRLPSRHNTNRRTPQGMVLNSTRGRHMLLMGPRPAQAQRTLRRARMRHTLCTPTFPSAPTTRLTRIHSPTGRLALARSRRRFRPRQTVLKPPLSSRDTRPMRRFPTARWTTCRKSPTGGLMVAARLTFRSLKTV
jgi:hypothetical protein